jgi:lipoprotein-releasing system permease protein
VIGLVGTLGGTLLGLAASVALGHYKLIRLDPSVYFIDHLPVALEPLDIVTTLLASVAIAAVRDALPGAAGGEALPPRSHPPRMSGDGRGR